jgi:hypothetical protein
MLQWSSNHNLLARKKIMNAGSTVAASLLRLSVDNMPQMQSVMSAATATNNATGTAEAAEDLEGVAETAQVML